VTGGGNLFGVGGGKTVVIYTKVKKSFINGSKQLLSANLNTPFPPLNFNFFNIRSIFLGKPLTKIKK
jgi:hypothetical protein